MENLILESKVAREILLNLNKNNVSFGLKISKEIKKVYCNVNNIMKKLEDLNLIERVKRQGHFRSSKYHDDKRRIFYKLTEKGKEVVKNLRPCSIIKITKLKEIK